MFDSTQRSCRKGSRSSDARGTVPPARAWVARRIRQGLLLVGWLGSTLSGASLLCAQSVDPPARATTHVVILGTGTPVADPQRSGPGVAVVVGDRAYLVDAGPGIVRRMAEASERGIWPLDPRHLSRVFISHLHSDHTLGLPDLMFTPWQNGRPRPLDVWGPPGIENMTAKIEEAWVQDIEIRRLGLERNVYRNYRAVSREIVAGPIYQDDRVAVEAIAVDHATWPVAFGFKFRSEDRTIVISGDARPSPSLVEACNGCDVLVHEVYSSSFLVGHPGRDYHQHAHTSTAELAKLAIEAKPGLLVLYHQLYGRATDDDLVEEVRRAGYSGKVVSARDLDVF